MVLFRKKRKRDEDLTSPEASRDKVEKPVRKGRTRKKEPPKPWGRKERIIVLIVLLFTLGTSVTLALSARNWKLPGLPQLKLQLPSFSFLKNETITLEGDRDEVREVFKSNDVISKFREMTNELSGVYGLYVVNLDTGFSYGVNENEIFQAASLIKLPVMVGMYLEEEDGDLNLDDVYELKDSDKLAGAGSLYSKPEGYEISYRELIEYMGQQSDNTAYNIAKNMLGVRKINEVTNYTGMTQTDFAENKTSPKDIGLLFQKLWEARLPAPERSDGGQGSFISKESADELLEYLTDTIYEQWLAAGIPDDIQVAHKYGREVHVVNDAGIIFASGPEGESPLVIVIVSDGVVEREADRIFPELARMVYEAETK